MVPRDSASLSQLSLQYEVVSILARSREASEGLARALERIVDAHSWDVGVAWLADGKHLRYATHYMAADSGLETATVHAFLASVRGWLRGKAGAEAGDIGADHGLCWCIGDVEQDAMCAWRKGAMQAGLHSAVAVPLVSGEIIYGAIELFSRERRVPHPDLERSLESVGQDLGKYLKLRRFETRMQSRNARLVEAQRIARLAYWECAVGTWQLRGASNMCEVLGLPEADLPGTLADYFSLVPQEQHAGLRAALGRVQDPNVGSIELEHDVVPPDGATRRVVTIRAQADFDSMGKPQRISGTLQDITPYRHLEERLRLAATAIDHAADAIVIFDARGSIVSTNRAFSRITGYAESAVRGRHLDDLLNRPSGRHDESFYRRILGRLRTFGHWKGELWARRHDGRDFAMLLSLSEVRDERGRVVHHVGVFTDISRQKEYEERLERLALHDSLTGLPNRALFLDRGQQALALAQRNGGTVGLIFVDLDLFKSVNDRYGHAVGDLVLRDAGARMRDLLRDCDTVARLGGDEFVILLTEVGGEAECLRVAERLSEVLTRPYRANGERIDVGASLGVALSPGHGSDIHTLLHRADQALYSIKRHSARRYAVWGSELDPAESAATPD